MNRRLGGHLARQVGEVLRAAAREEVEEALEEIKQEENALYDISWEEFQGIEQDDPPSG
jgi:hypothetical protein